MIIITIRRTITTIRVSVTPTAVPIGTSSLLIELLADALPSFVKVNVSGVVV